MPDLQSSDYSGFDGFKDLLVDQKGIYEVSPKMSEYIEMMETYLLFREKRVMEKLNSDFEISVWV